MSKFAWVTLTTNDAYSLGALVLAHSLRRAGTAHQLAVLVTPTVSQSMRDRLKDVYNVVQEVNVMDSQDAANLALLSRPELGVTFTKLHCWRLVQFEKCVFLDADTLVLKNCDELFEREELSAAPDVSWPDCFNSGVFVFKPSVDTFNKITEYAVQHGSFDGGDQGLLNQYFADWATADIKKHLPFVYNVTAYASYCYLPAFKQFRDNIKILHFAGKLKPWLIQFNSENKTATTPSEYAHAHDLIQLWWNIFCDNVHQRLSDDMCRCLNIMQNAIEIAAHATRYQSDNHHQHQHQQQQQQQQQPQQYVVHVREYRDPWADYYENVEKQQESSEQFNVLPSNDNQTADSPIVAASEEPASDANSTQNVPQAVESQQEQKQAQAQAQAQEQQQQQHQHQQQQQLQQVQVQVDSHHHQNDEVLKQSIDHNNAVNANTAKHDADSSNRVEHEAGLAGALSQLRLGAQRSPEQEQYENLMRRQCWESGQIDYAGRDSFDNIWKKISETLETKPAKDADQTELLTSADIEDGKVEYDRATGASTQYKLIEGGYEMITTTPQPNGTVKTQVRTFWDPKPVSEEDLAKEQENKKLVKQRLGKEVRIDKNTTMLTRAIEGGYEEVYTTVNEDGTRSMRTKTFYDSVPTELNENTTTKTSKTKKNVTRKSSVESTDSTDSRRVIQKVQQQKNAKDQKSNYREDTTIEESRRVTQNIEITENNRTVRKNSLQEQTVKAVTQSTSDAGKKKKKTKSTAPPPPADFVQNDTTTVATKRVPGGVEYVYSTELESGKTITTSKTVYEEEETELTEEEIKQYRKTLKDAEKHKNVTSTKKLKSESGTKKIVPSENPGDVTTVETIKIEGGTEYHYTTVTAEGIVKKAVKTVFDPVPSSNPDDTDEEEIIEEYEEEIIEPGEKNIKTIETIKQLPKKFEEEVTITHQKTEKKVKKSMVISQ